MSTQFYAIISIQSQFDINEYSKDGLDQKEISPEAARQLHQLTASHGAFGSILLVDLSLSPQLDVFHTGL